MDTSLGAKKTIQKIKISPPKGLSQLRTLEEARDLVRTEMEKHEGLKDWTLEFSAAKSRAGSARFEQKMIRIAAGYAVLVAEEKLRDCVLHEIAHALVGPGHNHDQVWKQKALEIGCSGDRCHTTAFSTAKYLVRCAKNCFPPAERHRLPPSSVRCSFCQGKIEFALNQV